VARATLNHALNSWKLRPRGASPEVHGHQLLLLLLLLLLLEVRPAQRMGMYGQLQ
jgi:hypothetical protein